MMQLFISFILFILISSPVLATTWYVRDGGGTATQCTGTTNAVYTSGSAQPCAFNHPAWAIGSNGYNGTPTSQLIQSGDTLYIDGDSDTTPGTQANYMIGYGMPNDSPCNTSGKYNCYLINLPAGSSGNQTSVIGTGTHRPQLWGVDQAYQILSAENDYITLNNLEITDHAALSYNNPVAPCISGSNPQADGIVASGNGGVYTNLYIHGNCRYGFNGGAFGSATFTNLWVIGNGESGVQIGSGGTQSVTGILTFNQPIIEWNGCVEAYPLTNAGIDNPLNYSNCSGQGTGGNGDGLAFGATGTENSGNWLVIGPGSISFNTQDGLDTLHGGGTGNGVTIDKMRFEGNAGQQVKITGTTETMTNSIVIGDCGWWQGAVQSTATGMSYSSGDACRSGGSSLRFQFGDSTAVTFYNNTIVTNAIGLEANNSSSCSGSTITSKNNIIVGGYTWPDDTTWNGAGGNSMTTATYNDGSDGNGSGTCGQSFVWSEDYNIIIGNKNSNSKCSGSHDQCGTNPSFASGNFPTGSAGGGQSTYYTGLVGYSLVKLGVSSPAINTGVSGLPYWYNSNDYYNNTFENQIGALTLNSTAANGWGCFLNSDCSSGNCSTTNLVTPNVCMAGGSNVGDSLSGSITMKGITFQ